VINCDNQTAIEEELKTYKAEIQSLIPELIYGYGEDTLEATIGQMLKERQLTIGTAESCTGGLLAHQIVSVSGASSYFEGKKRSLKWQKGL